MLTAFGSVDTAVQALREGAYHYLRNPATGAVARAGAQRAGEALARGGESHPARATRGGRGRRADRPLAAHGGVAHVSRGRRRLPGRGARPGRERHGQGVGGARDPPRELPARGAVREPQLRRAAGTAARERAVRVREGRLHRRGGGEAGAVRAGARGHHLSRRDRRVLAGAAGAPAARAPGEGGAASRRHAARRRRTSGSSRRPTATSRTRSRPGGFARISSTASTSSRSPCRRCASGARTSRCWRRSSSSGSPGARARPSRGFRGRPWSA